MKLGDQNSVPMDPLVIKAIDLAAITHANQFRKGTNTPYIAHPVAVGVILQHYGCSAVVIAAGMLHDTVEDMGLSLDEITNKCGPAVADIVKGCSEPDKGATWSARKRHTIEHLRTAPMDVRLVVAADKLHNITSIMADYEVHGDALWSRFNRGREDQAWYYWNVLDALASDGFEGHPLFIDLQLAISKMFKEVVVGRLSSEELAETRASGALLPKISPEQAAKNRARVKQLGEESPILKTSDKSRPVDDRNGLIIGSAEWQDWILDKEMTRAEDSAISKKKAQATA